MTGLLENVMLLRPVTYEARGKTVTGSRIGLIAEEVYEISPGVVPTEDGKPEAFNYEFLVAPLIGAIQEQQAQIEALEARIKILEGGKERRSRHS